jgi:glycosyltransferase involved in cell wall biosynthesis
LVLFSKKNCFLAACKIIVWDSGMPPWFTIVIPTRDSASWIGALLQHYADHRIAPIMLLDSRTSDGTRQVAAAYGVQVIDMTDFQFAEAVVARTRDVVPTQWALFLNDDEIPSDALFARLAGPPPGDGTTSIAISRRWAWHQPGHPLQYGFSKSWADRAGWPGLDHHWRLFQPRRVQFVAQMHSDGFLIDTWSRLPAEEFIIHFEWVLRTRRQRAAKIARYDAIRPGYGSFFANMYLPEDQPPGVIAYQAFPAGAYDHLAQACFKARPSRLAEWWAGLRDARAAAPPPRAEPVDVMDRSRLQPRPEREIPLA